MRHFGNITLAVLMLSTLSACGGGDEQSDDLEQSDSALDEEARCPTRAGGYSLSGFSCAHAKRVASAFSSLPSSLKSIPTVKGIVYEASAPNALFQRGTGNLVLNARVFTDTSERYVLAHEAAHAWSAAYGRNTYLGNAASRFVGEDFAQKGWSGYERCFPCDAGTTIIDDCYAAGNARAALSKGWTPKPEAWAEKMVGFDEDFAETVAAHVGARPWTVWLDDTLASCTPTTRTKWLNDNF